MMILVLGDFAIEKDCFSYVSEPRKQLEATRSKKS